MAEGWFIPLPRGWQRIIRRALLCAVGLERQALGEVRAGFEASRDPRARMTAEADRLREAVEVHAELVRILRARVGHIPPAERPHYPPEERLAILMLQARTGWSDAQTGRYVGVSGQTVGSWKTRLEERGSDALVQTPVPINRYDDAVGLLVQKLHQAAPGLGRRKKAELLGRAGLRLAASTIERLRKRKLPAPPPPAPRPDAANRSEPDSKTKPPERVVRAREPGHVWHVDTTSIAVGAPRSGFAVPWWPFSLVLRWALSWHVALVVDHFSRAILAFMLCRKEPTAAELVTLLDRAVSKAGRAPRHIISDQGSQFQSQDYRNWCKRHDVARRYGAVGRHGSIAIVERVILNFKKEFLWRIFVPSSEQRMTAALSAYQLWYNDFRTHSALGGRTPAQVLAGRVVKPVRFEPRARMPLTRGDPSLRRCSKLELEVRFVDGFKELPIVELRQAA